MPRRFVLTGAPGSGKTSLLQALAGRGWPVVHEAATDVIAREQAEGVDEPRLTGNFTSKIVSLQLERQLRSVRADVQLFDRSPVCTLALARYLGHPPTPALQRAVARAIHDGVYENEVFLVRPLGSIERTPARRISYAEALEFEAVHEAVYRELGFALVEIPRGSISARVAAVETHLRRSAVPGP